MGAHERHVKSIAGQPVLQGRSRVWQLVRMPDRLGHDGWHVCVDDSMKVDFAIWVLQVELTFYPAEVTYLLPPS